MAASPPLPPSPSLDDLLVPPIPPTPPIIDVPDHVRCGNFMPMPDDSSLDIFPPIDSTYVYMPPPIDLTFPETPVRYYNRGRSRSRSRSPSSRGPSPNPGPEPIPVPTCGGPIYVGGDGSGGPVYVTVPSLYDYGSSRSRSSSPESRSPSPPRHKRYTYHSRTPSPMNPSYTYIPPMPQIYPIPAPPPPVQPIMPPTPISPTMWPPAMNSIPESVDILTFNYNNSMAYAPAPKTYDEAIDNLLELWPDLREFDRDRIHLFVGGNDHCVRVPKMAWQLVMLDIPRYEIMHVQVDLPTPPPQYQSDGKGNWESGDEKKEEKKPAPSRGFFSSIKRIFWRR